MTAAGLHVQLDLLLHMHAVTAAAAGAGAAIAGACAAAGQLLTQAFPNLLPLFCHSLC
jgi:hypothetical protein